MTIITIILAYIYTFINGMNDGCNVIATIIASKSIGPKKALIIVCISEILGSIFVGTAVASTVAKRVVKYSYLNSPGSLLPLLVVLAALVGAILWNVTRWKLGIPSSSSYALFGGLLGSGIAAFGIWAIDWPSFLIKVVAFMMISPLIGFFIGYTFMKISLSLFEFSNPKINKLIKKVQVFSTIILGAGHGSSDGQKSAGVIALLLVIAEFQKDFIVPKWTIITSTSALVLGILCGGWNIIKTVGSGIYNVKPLHSFNTQISAAFVVAVSNIFGIPVSTTQIVASSIMGVGSAERINAVKWLNVKNIIQSWFITIPASAAASALCFFILRSSFKFFGVTF